MSEHVLKVAVLSPFASSFYFDGRGWTLVVPGHGHSPEALAELGDEEWGEPCQSDEDWFVLHKRIMRCDRLGFGCDMEGEWHRHLEPVRKGSSGCEFTVIWPAPVVARPAPQTEGDRDRGTD